MHSRTAGSFCSFSPAGLALACTRSPARTCTRSHSLYAVAAAASLWHTPQFRRRNWNLFIIFQFFFCFVAQFLYILCNVLFFLLPFCCCCCWCCAFFCVFFFFIATRGRGSSSPAMCNCPLQLPSLLQSLSSSPSPSPSMACVDTNLLLFHSHSHPGQAISMWRKYLIFSPHFLISFFLLVVLFAVFVFCCFLLLGGFLFELFSISPFFFFFSFFNFCRCIFIGCICAAPRPVCVCVRVCVRVCRG